MTDDVRAAAGRLLRDHDDPDRRADLGESDLYDRLRDGAAVARAYLALAPDPRAYECGCPVAPTDRVYAYCLEHNRPIAVAGSPGGAEGGAG